MSNFELIDDYLTNRLNEQDRKSFEQQLVSDASLKTEMELQKEIIQGLRTARVAELKSILNNVPIATNSIFFSPLRIAAGLIGAAVLATGLYFYSDKSANFNPNQLSSSIVDSIRQSEEPATEVRVDSVSDQLNEKTQIDQEKEIKKLGIKTHAIVGKENAKESKPAIDLLDPTDDLMENNDGKVPENTSSKNTTIVIASIEVSVNTEERKYKSHYQFANGKLILYGNFDHGLYEIIEVNGQNSQSLFLYYKTAYYILDESKKTVTMLKEISDPVLIQKLNTFRSN